MQIFILQAQGAYVVFSGSGKILCKKAFRTKESAEKYKPEFRKACVTPKSDVDLFYLADNESLKIIIGEMELED